MGIIIGKFRRKKTTFDVLEKLENQIREIEEFKRDTELAQKKVIGRVIIFSIGIYLVVAFVLCYYWMPPTFSERIKYIAPLVCAPFLLFYLKRALAWYYNRKLTKNQTKLKALKEEKKKLLDQVMETETYKVAKGILEKFAPEQIRKSGFTLSGGSELTPLKPGMGGIGTPATTGLRMRIPPSSQLVNRPGYYSAVSNIGPLSTPTISTVQPSMSQTSAIKSTNAVALSSAITPIALPRPVIPRNRSVLDKMVEYLIGDGPSNRYALICKNCDGHNGMALKEEFEYFSFRCCYCYFPNPARKKKPAAPKLEFEAKSPIQELKMESDTSDSERLSRSDSDSDQDSDKVKTLFNAEDSKLPDNENIIRETTIVESPSAMDVDEDESVKETADIKDLKRESDDGESSRSEEIKEKSDDETEKEKGS